MGALLIKKSKFCHSTFSTYQVPEIFMSNTIYYFNNNSLHKFGPYFVISTLRALIIQNSQQPYYVTFLSPFSKKATDTIILHNFPKFSEPANCKLRFETKYLNIRTQAPTSLYRIYRF